MALMAYCVVCWSAQPIFILRLDLASCNTSGEKKILRSEKMGDIRFSPKSRFAGCPTSNLPLTDGQPRKILGNI